MVEIATIELVSLAMPNVHFHHDFAGWTVAAGALIDDLYGLWWWKLYNFTFDLCIRKTDHCIDDRVLEGHVLVSLAEAIEPCKQHIFGIVVVLAVCRNPVRDSACNFARVDEMQVGVDNIWIIFF